MPDPNQQNSSSSEQLSPRKGSRGFTLVELVMVVAIIVALAAISIPAYNNYVDKARVTVAISTLDTVRKHLEFFHLDNQQYPTKPIDFSTGTDGAATPQTVFSTMLLDQINDDLTPISYNTATNKSTYTLIAEAKDRNQTVLTLTPSEVSKAP